MVVGVETTGVADSCVDDDTATTGVVVVIASGADVGRNVRGVVVGTLTCCGTHRGTIGPLLGAGTVLAGT